ncbi:MAG TPA: hypothetical protein VFH42_04670 [Sporolactobacillaceae bacterium]|nr:hypothetical protein [Sporolactobacillaceae bacterium]
MLLLKKMFTDRCPVCQEALVADSTHLLLSHVKKSCPNGHFEKELHPALETVIEMYKS